MPQLAFLLSLVCTLLSVLVASFMGEYLRKEHPNLKPYKWGYFNGWMGVFSGIATSILGLDLLKESYDSYPNNNDVYMMIMVYGVLAFISGIFIIKRNKWGWVGGVILQLNPVLWIINAIYAKNRWSELNGPSLSEFKKKPLAFRVLVVGSVFWAFVVLVFVYVFEPFGNYADFYDKSQYWWRLAKIIFFPPLVAAVGYFLYAKLVQSHNI